MTAKAFNFQFQGFAWYDVVAGDKSSDGKQVLGYRKAIYDALKEIKHPNPSQCWAMICAYGREELGLPPKVATVKPAHEKAIKALTTAYKILSGIEQPTESEVEAGYLAAKALAQLGVEEIK
jgi:hypothetical protein